MRRRYALITGASSGIGAALARLAARSGFDVGLAARRVDRLEALAGELRKLGVRADALAADLSRDGAGAGLAEAVIALGRDVDVLINNAGATVPPSFSGTSLHEQDAFVALTIAAPVQLTHCLLPDMLARRWGRIINISSLAALSSGGKGNTLYPAGKAFLLKFSQSLNAEVKDRGVHVTAVLPGIVATEFQAANGIPMQKGAAARRFAQTADEVAREAWARNDRGCEIVTPGSLPKIAAALMRVLPEPLMRTLTRAAAEKYYVGE